MQYAERSASPVTSKRFEWSPKLAQAMHALRFWELCWKKSIGLLIHDTALQKEAVVRAVKNTNEQTPLTYTSIVKHHRAARQTLKEY
jgi:peroxiredoxin